MIMSLILFENEFLNIVSISFTALILNELIMVALEITIWYVSRLSSFGWLTDLWRTFAGTFIWSLRRSLRCSYMQSASLSYPSISVRTSTLPRTMVTFERMALRRPFVCHFCALRLEGGRHRGRQRFPAVRDQVHQEQDLPCGFEQTFVIYLLFNLDGHVVCDCIH
jgi:hypothetical protein